MFIFETEMFTLRKTALWAGLSIIAMAICAGFSYGFVHSSLIVQDDVTNTMSALSQSINLKTILTIFINMVFVYFNCCTNSKNKEMSCLS